MNETVFTNMMVELVKTTPNNYDLGELCRALTAKYVKHIETSDQGIVGDITSVNDYR